MHLSSDVYLFALPELSGCNALNVGKGTVHGSKAAITVFLGNLLHAPVSRQQKLLGFTDSGTMHDIIDTLTEILPKGFCGLSGL